MCKLPGCPIAVKSRGYCGRHYARANKFQMTDAQMLFYNGSACMMPGCGRTERLDVDHDSSCCSHRRSSPKTCGRCTRGLICHTCNMKIRAVENGFREPTVIERSYLDAWRAVRDGKPASVTPTTRNRIVEVPEVEWRPADPMASLWFERA